jgi:hypothetical protein
MGVIYALAEYGIYDEFGYEFIKIDEADKEKFIKYCEESQKLNECTEVMNFSRDIVCFVKGLEIYGEYKIVKTMDELKERFREDIESANIERNYLHKFRDRLPKLLDFEFIPVK